MSYRMTPKHFRLRFSYHNSKLIALAKMLKLKLHQVAGFGLLAGVTCPSADLCKAYVVVRTSGRELIKHGKYTCFMAQLEVGMPDLHRLHKANTKFVASASQLEITKALLASINDNPDLRVIRTDTSGDFYDMKYYMAWITIANELPHLQMFGYTKELHIMYDILDRDLPNFKFVYSYGGVSDHIATKDPDLPYSRVVLDEQHAANVGLEVACPTPDSPNDYNYIISGRSFALLAHSTSKKNLKVMAQQAAAAAERIRNG